MRRERRDEPGDGEAGGKRRTMLLGLGLDGDDGHVRMTRGPEFRLVGGSEETHEGMQRTAIRFREKLKRRGKHIDEVSRDELRDMVRESME